MITTQYIPYVMFFPHKKNGWVYQAKFDRPVFQIDMVKH